MAGKLMQTTRTYRHTLERILEERKTIDEKTDLQLQAFESGARALEYVQPNNLRDLAIIRYHAAKPLAVVMQDEYTRGAIKAAIHAMDRYIADGADRDE